MKVPALDACVMVERSESKDHGVWFEAGPWSRWFGWNDARNLLRELRLGNEPGELLNSQVPYGRQLQTLRQVCNPALLAAAAEEIAHRPVLFVSYRWRGAGSLPARVAKAAAEAGFAPWVDRWAAPRRIAQGLEQGAPPALCSLLRRAIHSCSAAAAILTRGYAKSHWTALELATFEELGLPLLSLSPDLVHDEARLLAALTELRGQIALSTAEAARAPLDPVSRFT